ncbi:MAG: hypothetical protein JXA44_00415 [Methanospirillaceae archaeon]|nr:hypothetical protein [Methanospirillaceae archaeon]
MNDHRFANLTKKKRFPLFILILSSVLVILISYYALFAGWTTIFQNLYYFPIIIACFFFLKRGFLFSLLLVCSYLGMVLIFTRDPDIITGAIIRVVIFIGIAGVITSLSVCLNSAKEQALKSDKLKTIFLETMSHELRTPLNSIIGFTGILLLELTGPLNPEQKKQLGLIQSSARHLLCQINDILDISKIETEELIILQNPVDIPNVVNSSVRAMIPDIEKKGLLLEVDIAPDAGVIQGDSKRLEQVIMNLLSNAIKFTDTGTISVQVTRDKNEVVIQIRDTGIGIAENDRTSLFMPFQQVESGSTRRYDGAGLGLPIAGKLIELHKGRIEVSSSVGEGSEFRVYLPAT